MSKIGVLLKINVSKLDKSRFFVGEKGTYADLTVFIDTENPSKYGDHGGIAQTLTQEERANKAQLPYVGNAKVFWEGQSQPRQQNQGYKPQQGNQQGYQNTPMGKPQSGYQQGPPPVKKDDSIPF